MAAITAEWIEEKAQEVMAVLSDGFEITDLFTIVPVGMEIVEAAGNLTGEEKRATFIDLMTAVIHKTDTPWLPDSLIDPVLIRCLGPLADMAAKFSKGEFAVNAS